MKILAKYITLACTFMGFGTLHAQEFQISAEYRPRYEFRDGVWKMRPADDKLDKANNTISQRARLNFAFADKDNKLKLFASLQDVRTWGSTAQLNTDNPNSFDIHQFWGELLFSKKISAKIGRQELVYDNQRIFGNVDWMQQARSFDAAVFKYEDADNKFKVHAGIGYNTKSDTATFKQSYTNVSNYKALQYLWLNKKIGETVNASILFLNNGMEYTKPNGNAEAASDRAIAYSQTIGGRVEYKKKVIGVNVEGYYQGGKDKANTTLNAWDLAAELATYANKHWSFVAGAEWLSGTDQDNSDGKDHSFNPYYGTNHKFNGYMDYFYVGNRWLTGNTAVGLADYYVGARYKESKWNGELAVHQFNSMATVLDNAGLKMKRNLGIETDLVVGYKFTDYIGFQGGYSFYKGTSTLQQLQPGSDKDKLNSWGWVQININPILFSYKKQ